MARVFTERGLRIVSGGTDDHLFLLDLTPKDVTGKDADAALGRAHITVNKNAIPNDPQPPYIASGLRIGTPAGTTRGFGQEEFSQIAHWISDILDDISNESVIDEVRGKVADLCARFPVYEQ